MNQSHALALAIDISFVTFVIGSSRRSAERDRTGTASSVTVASTEGATASGNAVVSAGSSAVSGALNVTASTGSSDRDRVGSTGPSGSTGVPSNSDRDTIFRWRDRQYYSGPKRWLESALRDPAWQDKEDDASGPGGKKKENNVCPSPLWLGDELEFWPEKTGSKEPVRFTTISVLHSELVAVSSNGHLYQWRWCDMTPFRGDNPSGNHPRAASLGLTNEKVVKISASNIRCTVVTESGKVATWMDESVSHVCSKLEHGATSFSNEFHQNDRIASLHTCVLYTAVRLENSGHVYWWGILPFNQRKRLLDKYANKKRSIDKYSSSSGKSNSKKNRPISSHSALRSSITIGGNGSPIGNHASSQTNHSSSSDITVGSQVCLRKVPMYHSGSIGFTVAGGVPKVGQLLNSAWNVTDTCRFKIIQPPKKPKLPELPKEKEKQKEDYDTASMPPPPSPASSTCSDGSLSSPAGAVPSAASSASAGPTGAVAASSRELTGASRRQKRSAPREDGPEKVDEEEWNLKDVVFVEDSRNIPIGRVWKVDGLQTLVHFPTIGTSNQSKKDKDAEKTSKKDTGEGFNSSQGLTSGEKIGKNSSSTECMETNDSSSNVLSSNNVRILSRDQLQLVKQGALPRVPDCFQRTPKRVCLQQNESGQILALNVDGKGIHAVVKMNDKTCYRLFNISTGKTEIDSKFPTDTQAFLGLDPLNNIRFYSTGEPEFASLLLDGNRTIYPLVKDSTPSSDSIKDPHWLDLPPIGAIGLGTHALPHVGSGKKNEVAVVVLSFTPQTLIPKILQCDIEGIKRIVGALEADPTAVSTVETVQGILEERCDGGRNVIHTLVSMCQPTSNKDSDQDASGLSAATAANVGLESIESITSAISSRAANLRDMMRRAAAASRLDSTVSLSGAGNPPSSIPPTIGQNSTLNVQPSMVASGVGPAQPSISPSGALSPLVMEDPSLAASLPWPPEPLEASDEDSLLGPSAASTAAAAAANSHALAAAAAMAAGSMVGSLGSQSPKTKAPGSISQLSAPIIVKDGKPYIPDNQERRSNALAALKSICDSPVFLPHLELMFAMQDAQGNTPFMASVANRAYPAALVLFDAAKKVARESSNDEETQKKTLMSMIFPEGSPADNSPLHVICCNDTCSFTWTGAEHINQDIFECRTCGLTDSLCCCTECARVCHKGHDCKLKRTSPTAYCDCWEKCRCKSTVGGHQGARFDVLARLVSETGLVGHPNGRDENILLFLVQTVGRQLVEQRQYRPTRSRKSAAMAVAQAASRKTPSSDMQPEMPEHDLEPPRFSRRALECLLSDWNALKSMILTGQKGDQTVYRTNPVYEDQAFLSSQSGTALLDKFTHCLLVKCSSDMLDVLLTTIINKIQMHSDQGEAKYVAKRFVRSVTRVFVVFNVEMAPGQTKKKSVQSAAQPLQRCKRVFQALINIAVEELCETANALLAPVRYGLARPTAPFNLTSNSDLTSVEELFAVEPLIPKIPGNNINGSNRNHRSRTRSLTMENILQRLPVGGNIRSSQQVGRDSSNVGTVNRMTSGGLQNQTNSPGVHVQPSPAIIPPSDEQPPALPEEEVEENLQSQSNEQHSIQQQPPDMENDDSMGANIGGRGGADADVSIDAGDSNGDVPIGDNPNDRDEDQENDMDLYLFAETESESETENEANEPGVGGEIIGSLNGLAQDPNNENSGLSGANPGNSGVGIGHGTSNDAFFSDDDSGESSRGDDDESEAGETDEQDGDEFNFVSNAGVIGGPGGAGVEELLERRSTGIGSHGGGSDRSNIAPAAMQWAIRSRSKAGRNAGVSGNVGSGVGNGGGFIYIDPQSLRRTTSSATAVAAAAAAAAAGGGGSVAGGITAATGSGAEPVTMSTTVASLARAFGIVVRQIADLLTMLQDYSALAPTLPRILDISYQESINLQLLIEYLMKPNWEWLMAVLDSTEAQLRFGSALAGSTDASHPSHPLFAATRTSRASTNAGTGTSSLANASSSHHGHSVGGHGGGGHLERATGFSTSRATLASLTGAVTMSSDPQSNRRDFLNYALSLMRSHNAEHSDSLPVIDVSAMKHIAYVFDALIYYMRSGTEAIDDANLTMSSTPISAPQGISSFSVLRSNTGIVPVTAAVASTNQNVIYGEENEPDDLNDDSLLEENSQPGTIASGAGATSAQPMELDYDDENTNQSTVSNQGVEHKTLGTPSARNANSINIDQKSEGQMKGEPEKEKTSNVNVPSHTSSQSGHRHQSRGRKHTFFQRSESTLCLGCPPPDPFQSPLQEALPLADQPQLLQPNARREDMFGAPKQPVAGNLYANHLSPANPLSVLPTRLGLASRSTDLGFLSVSGSRTPQADLNAANFALSTAPYQAGPSSEANFERIVSQQRSGIPSPAAATCDTASVRSLDTTVNANLDDLDEPQDLSMGGMSAASSDVSEMVVGGDDSNIVPAAGSTASLSTVGAGPSTIPIATSAQSGSRSVSFTSPKKAFMMRVGEQQSSTSSNLSSSTLASVSLMNQQTGHSGATDVLVVPTNSALGNADGPNMVVGTNAPVGSVLGASGEVSANVTIETSNANLSATRNARNNQLKAVQQQSVNLGVPHDVLLGRWRLTLDLFGRVFVDDVGLEPGSIISELGGFPVKEAKFRREMEKLRNSRTVDLTLSKLDRERGKLIVQAFREFNTCLAQNM